jgi:hypothetical protein
MPLQNGDIEASKNTAKQSPIDLHKNLGGRSLNKRFLKKTAGAGYGEQKIHFSQKQSGSIKSKNG